MIQLGKCPKQKAGVIVIHTSCVLAVSFMKRIELYILSSLWIELRKARLVPVTSSWLEMEIYFSDVLEEDI